MRWSRGVVGLASVLALAAGCSAGRPAAAPSSPPSATPTVTATPTPSPTPPPRHVFPVVGDVSYGHSHHGYPATDIIADCGLTYVAPYPGVIHQVNRVDGYDPGANAGASRGGLSVSLLGDDGVRYYGSHFSAIDAGIEPGTRVSAGEPLATVGRTGDASACHVHFGLSPVCSDGDWFVRRGMVWPWPYLDSWRVGGNADPAPEITQLMATSGCPDRPLVEP